MRLLDKPLGSITSEDILYLKNNRIQESQTLEYKRELPGNTDNDKKEFLADVTAFANTYGGIIIYGIEEEKDDQNKNSGIPKEIVGLNNINTDYEKQRIENILRDGVDPRLSNVMFKEIDVNGHVVLLINIPRSLVAPHIIWFQKSGRFYCRTNSGKYQMDVREIRQAFLQTDEWERRADNFRRNRIMDVRALKFISNLHIQGSFFIHIIPLGSRETNIDFNKHHEKLSTLLRPYFYLNYDNRFNLDGLLVFGNRQRGGTKICESYIQYFRNGGVEIFTSNLDYRSESPITLDGSKFMNFVIENIKTYFSYTSNLGVEAPIVVYISYLDSRDVRLTSSTPIVSGKYIEYPNYNQFDRDEILLPGIYVEDTNANVSQFLRPAFDAFWQAAGWSGCPS